MKIRAAFDSKETRPSYLWGWLPSPHYSRPIKVNDIEAVWWSSSDKAIETLERYIYDGTNQEPQE